MARGSARTARPLGAASWGKFTLCVLGLYDWRGLHPCCPSCGCCLPAPMHPGRLWCHCRQVYLPMAWLYGSARLQHVDAAYPRASGRALRAREVRAIDWERNATRCAATTSTARPPARCTAVNLAQGRTSGCHSSRCASARSRNASSTFATKTRSPTYRRHRAGEHGAEHRRAPLPRGRRRGRLRRGFAALDTYLWDGHDGMKMQGYNSSELWDRRSPSRRHWRRLRSSGGRTPGARERVRVPARQPDPRRRAGSAEAHYRHRRKGGWPFSNRAHGWPITDCTSEGLKCAWRSEAACHGRSSARAAARLGSAAALLAERRRWLVDLRDEARRRVARSSSIPRQVFGDIMVDYSHVECTSACVQALIRARQRLPRLSSTSDIDRAQCAGAERLSARAAARDGSFEG